ncbi:MAG: GntR family transcriptional regulator [Sneathiellaceae bacterium]
MTEKNEISPALERIETGTLQAQIYHSLTRALMRGEFAPGQSVSMRHLAATFGVSTMPVRGAIQQLIADGALHFTSSRSVAVPAMSRARLNDLCRVRLDIEGTAAQWAATGITATEVEALHRIDQEYDAIYRMPDLSARVADHLAKTYKFRFAVYGAAHSEILLGIIESLWLKIAPYFNLLLDEWPQVAEQGRKYRVILINALELRDGNAARAAIQGEIERVSALLLDKLPAE